MNTQVYDAVIVGTGPAGWACALGMIDAGLTPLMLDVGINSSCDTQLFASQVRRNPTLLDSISPTTATEKSWLGDEFMYRRPAGLPPFVLDDFFAAKSSMSLGGLSNAWGASCDVWSSESMKSWPADARLSQADFGRIMTHLPIAPANSLADFSDSRVTRRIYARTDECKRRGVSIRPATLAIDALDCKLCGRCATGCAWNAIFETGSRVSELAEKRKIILMRGAAVKECCIEKGIVLVKGINIADDGACGSSFEIQTRACVLAAGALNTAEIVLRSVRGSSYETTLTLAESPLFIQPFVSALGNNVPIKFSMAHLFASFEDGSHHEHAHIQIYAPSIEIAGKAVTAMPYLVKHIIRNHLTRRLGAAFIYLDSSHGQASRMVLASSDSLVVSTDSRLPASRRLARDVAKRIAKTLGRSRFLPLLRPLDLGIGSSNHIGGSLPMSSSPGPLQTSTRGAVEGLPGLFIADSSVLPSIPSNTITTGVMANAYRIGTHVTNTLK
jgi:choline dehydrogenase-like flavoprotein